MENEEALGRGIRQTSSATRAGRVPEPKRIGAPIRVHRCLSVVRSPVQLRSE